MSTITRAWIGLAALCAGLIHLGLVVSSPLPAAVVLVVIGLAECAWGVLAFARERLARPRLVLAGALVPTILWALLVAVASLSRTPALASFLGFTALMIATLFELFVAIVVAVLIRRGTDFSRVKVPGSSVRYLVGVLAGALLFGALVTPALAATDAGKYARPMGDMDMGAGVSTAPQTSLVIDNH
jgi:hypothetical protein